MARAKKTATKKTTVKKVYTCKTCGRTTSVKKHLCNPGKVDEAYTCE